MFDMEHVLLELTHDDINDTRGLPPGFRFHPTDEEIITFYLASKVFRGTFYGVEIAEVDLNRCEPWHLPEVAKMGDKEWYFFSLRDRKYPTGLRTNRATRAGYWKATGKDRQVYSSASSNKTLLGMKKTLVFYKGRAPRGEKTKWVMHEYRLDGNFSYRHTCKEEWVICRIFNKTGDKKCQLLDEASSATLMVSGSLPPLLETRTTTTFQEDDHKALINPVVDSHSPHNVLPFYECQQPPQSLSPTTTAVESTSMFFKSLLSHQDFTSKEHAALPKQCRTEANFSSFLLPDDANMQWLDKIQANPMWFEMDCSMLGFSAADTVHEMSARNLNTPIGLLGDSWPLDYK